VFPSLSSAITVIVECIRPARTRCGSRSGAIGNEKLLSAPTMTLPVGCSTPSSSVTRHDRPWLIVEDCRTDQSGRLAGNTACATSYLAIPSEQAVEIGTQIDL
jgi:hypothetical protein